MVMVAVALACSAPAATTSVPDPAAAAATTTVAPATTEAITATTADPDTCPPGGGGQTSRGVHCPPDMWAVPAGYIGGFLGRPHAPGTYQTTFFEPEFEFTQPDQFTGFETDASMVLDRDGCFVDDNLCRELAVLGPVVAAQATLDLDDAECVLDAATSQGVLFGRQASVLNLQINEICTLGYFPSGVFGRPNILEVGVTARLMTVNMDDDTQIMVIVQASTDFDRYLAEVAQPIIDSIDFLDQ